jgi:hypothetical protein
MRSGLLWLDDGKAALDEKVRRAAAHYRHKYGRQPEVCFVHKAELAGELQVDEIVVCPAQYVLRHHLWLGMKNS